MSGAAPSFLIFGTKAEDEWGCKKALLTVFWSSITPEFSRVTYSSPQCQLLHVTLTAESDRDIQQAEPMEALAQVR